MEVANEHLWMPGRGKRCVSVLRDNFRRLEPVNDTGVGLLRSFGRACGGRRGELEARPWQTVRGWIEESLSKETQKRQTQSRRQAKNVGVMEAKKNALGGRDRVRRWRS